MLMDSVTWRKDGAPMTFNETFSHDARNDTEKTRLILFYDVTRSQKNRHLQFIAEWLSDKIMSAAVSPKTPSDKTGFNRLSKSYWACDNSKKKLREWNKNIYLETMCILLLVIAFYFIYFIFYI